MTDNSSAVVRVKYSGARETSTELLSADNLSIRASAEGRLILELFRYGANDRAIEGYQLIFCPEDKQRLLDELVRRR